MRKTPDEDIEQARVVVNYLRGCEGEQHKESAKVIERLIKRAEQ